MSLESKQEKGVENTSAERLALKLDLNRLRASHILQLQEILKSHPGTTAVEIAFCNLEQEVATLVIDKAKGITPSDALQQACSLLPLL